ncbi:sulfotransferase [Roseibium sp. RKSG952]|uniref:tetratricopeptide repeat-containing sulfotransferase family protein n=1 Tax=Roseibium sp. RKSG952 TaxID=2529384 RepID=UPI0012BD38FB|nr:sulfotransferase [Roseibium sp. RKSG952]MTH96621.1 hypothetical protein [Roseibium sp. RKSG952]
MSGMVQAQPPQNKVEVATTLFHDKCYENSLELVEAAIAEGQRTPTAWYLKALNLRSLKRSAEAVPILEVLHRELPDNADIFAILCHAAFECGMVERAIQIAKQGVATHDTDLQYYDILIQVLLGTLRYFEAQQVCMAAIRLDMKNAKRWLKLAECYANDQNVAKAAAALAEVKALAPNVRGIRFAYSEQIARLGGKREAIKLYRSLLKEEFEAKVFSALAHADKVDPNGMLARRAKSTANTGRTSTDDKAHLKFGLAVSYDKAGDYDRAAEYYVAANALKSEVLSFSRDELAEKHKSIKNAFSPDHCTNACTASTTSAPIFIVGMPRSGSTLIEQILSSHTCIEGAGEVSYLNRLTYGSTPTPFAQEYVGYSQDEKLRFAKNYIQLVKTGCDFKIKFTDKNLFNWKNIGYIFTAFPNAKVIHCRRDARASNLSIFKLPYSDNVPFSASVSDLSWFRTEYEDMMQFWEKRFPGRILHVDYEETVLDLEAQSRRVLDYLELTWEAQVLAFHENKRAAFTASHDQVRQKLYQSSLEPWRKYEGTRLAEALGF